MSDGKNKLKIVSAAWPRHAPYLVIFLMVAALHGLGVLWPIDRLSVDAGFSLSDRKASGHLALVQIDPASIKKIDVWPWPRSVHADVIDRLVAAGATEIGYDVDFSSRSDEAQDRRLAGSLTAAKTKIILPAFRQRSMTQGRDLVIHQTLPLKAFRDPVQLGSVIFRPFSDGLIRSMNVTASWKDGAMPAMSALLAGPAAFNMGSFHIDYGIDVASIRRYSLADVLEGRVPARDLKGKKILVGAAATELGDQHAVPKYGRLHGMDVQALAFESLVQGRALHTVRPEIIIAFLLLMTLMLGARLENFTWQVNAMLGAALSGGVFAIGIAAQAFFPVIIPTTAMILLMASFVVYSAYRDLWGKAILIFRQGMNLSHQRAFIDQVLENSFDGVLVTDAKGIIVAHNEAAANLLRVSGDALTATRFDDVLPAETEILFPDQEPDRRADQGSPKEPIVIRFNPPDEDEYYLEFMQGEFTRGISPQHPAENRRSDRVFKTYSFRNVTARMNREAAQLAEKELAIEQNRAKSTVLASMSHELRTPLNAILGFSEVMKLESLGPLTAKYRSYADGIHESGKHLLTLVDEMLDVARIEGGYFDLNETLFDVSRSLRQCMQIVDGWRETSNRSLILDMAENLPLMMGDARLVRQCVINLISNSVKYSENGDTIKVSLDRDERNDLYVEVQDTGKGISDDQVDMIIRPFYRAGDSNIREQDSGIGLGLALVDAYVRAHDGQLKISSSPGDGMTVRLTFPKARLFDADHNHPTDDPDESERGDNIIDFRG